jgi:hypothetical protein
VRLRITQFTIRRLMATVAVIGLVFGCLAWIWRRVALDFHIHDSFIMVGPYVFASDSAAFWAILLLLLALLMALLVGFLAAIVCTAKAIGNRII